jgi:hypothetical protein
MVGISIIVFVLSLMLTACTPSPGEEANASEPPSETTVAIDSTFTSSPDAMITESPLPPAGIDRTIDLSVLDPFKLDGKTVISERYGVALLEFGTIYFDAGDLSEDAKDIVVGEVLATYYTDVDAGGMIFYDFKLSEVLRGDLGAGDTITVVSYGGYIRGSVYVQVHGDKEFDQPLTEDDLILSSSGVPLPIVGDRYVLFMLGCDNSRYAAGAYGVCGDFMGRYFLDGESVKRYAPVDAPYFYTKNGERFDASNPIPNDPKTLSELRTIVSETPLIDKQESAD